MSEAITKSIPLLEVCCGDIASVEAARLGGASRVELCSALAGGGVTPSAGFIARARAIAGADMKVHVLIRHREGDFVYTTDEIEIMHRDIAEAGRLGADGVVIGALTPEGDIDMDACRRMLEARGDMSVTFSRAFDLCRNPKKALEQVIELRCDRLLTSGLEPSAEEGITTLARLNAAAGGRVILLAGAGVNAANAPRIIKEAGVREVHASARESIGSTMIWRSPKVKMGAPGSDEYSRKTTTVRAVREIVDNISKL